MDSIKIQRREFTKTSLTLSTGTLVIPPFYIGKSKPKLGDEILGHGDFKYRVYKEWGDLDPAKTPVKNCQWNADKTYPVKLERV